MIHTPDSKLFIRTISTGGVLLLLFILAASLAMAGESPGNVMSGSSNNFAGDPVTLPTYVSGQLVVKFGSQSDPATDAFESASMSVAGYLGHSGVYLVDVNNGADLELISGQLAAQPEVEYAHPNYTFVRTHSVQGSYPFPDEVSSGNYLQQPAVTMLNLDDAQQAATGTGITVAVIDGGMKLDHPMYEGKAVSAYDYVDEDIDASDEAGGTVSGHGTFVGGVVHLVAPNAVLRSYRVIDVNGYGNGFDLARAIEQAVDDGCQLINISLVLSARHLAVRDAINYAASQGVTVVGATGNESLQEPVWPAAEDNVVAVAAVDENMAVAEFSNIGSYVDVCAPGIDIYSGYLETDYAWWSGTSFAAPFVTGAAALLREIDADASPGWLDWVIRYTALDLDTENPAVAGFIGSGLIDPEVAVSAVNSSEQASLSHDTLTVEVIQGAEYLVAPFADVHLSSTNAPADYTFDVMEDDARFAYVYPIMGHTNDSIIIQLATLFPDVGRYFNTVRFWVEGVPSPVDLVVCQEVVANPNPGATAQASPNHFEFYAADATEIMFYGASNITSSNAPATFNAMVVEGADFITLEETSGTTPDSLRFTVDPALVADIGVHSGLIAVDVEGVDEILNIPVSLTLVDSLITGDSAWITVEPGATFNLPVGAGEPLTGLLHVNSTNAPADYLLGFFSEPLFTNLGASSGTTNGTVGFTISAEGLEAGIYHDTVRAWVDGVDVNPVSKVLTLVVGDGSAGTDSLMVSPSSANFYMTQGLDSMTLFSIEVSAGGWIVPYSVNIRDEADFVVLFDTAGTTDQSHLIGVVNDVAFAPGIFSDTLEFWADGASSPILCPLHLHVTDGGGGDPNDSLFVLTPNTINLTVPVGQETAIPCSVLVQYPDTPETYAVLEQGFVDLVQFDIPGGTTGEYFHFDVINTAERPAGVYFDTLSFYLDNYTLPDHGPVYCLVQLSVGEESGGGSADTSHLNPAVLSFSAAEGSNEIQTGTVTITFPDPDATFFGYVAGGDESFATLVNSSGSVGDDVTIEINPGGLSAGMYYDSVLFEVDGYNNLIVLQVELAIDSVQEMTSLNNFPNPFNPQTTIAFDLTRAGDVQLRIYNVLGQEVVTLVDEHLNAGRHEFIWNGRSAGGHEVGSGVYFYRLTTERATATRKLLLLR